LTAARASVFIFRLYRFATLQIKV